MPAAVAGCFAADRVVNPQREFVRGTTHLHARRALAGVAHDVGQCFLNDAKRGQINTGWQPVEIARNFGLHLQASLCRASDEIAERGESAGGGARGCFMTLAQHIQHRTQLT